MLLDECERLLDYAQSLKMGGRKLLKEANEMEALVFRLAGINNTTQDTGFPSWTIEGSDGYFNSPMEAIRAMRSKEKAETR